jgi:hypothetical protein
MDSGMRFQCKSCREACRIAIYRDEYEQPEYGSDCCNADILDALGFELTQVQLEAQVEWEKEGNLDTEGM